MPDLTNVFQELWDHMPRDTRERILRVWAEIDESAEDKLPAAVQLFAANVDGGGISRRSSRAPGSS
jgi:hypothetical protein